MPDLTEEERLAAAERIVGHRFGDRCLLAAALRHPSAAENLSHADSYERLEFLGDAVLGAVVAVEAYRRYPKMSEGQLTELKIALVSGKMLADMSERLGVRELIEFGDAERGTGDRGVRKALEDVFEALVGATFIDGGIDAARRFVLEQLGPHMTPEQIKKSVNPKTRLQSITQSGGRGSKVTPTYRLVGMTGPAHARVFTSVALVENDVIGRGEGSSKKESESAAAADAIARIEATGSIAGAIRL